MKTGIELIAEERARQISVEGWSAEHDDTHTDGSLAVQAAVLACQGTDADVHDALDRSPWNINSSSRIDELAKAGALIAAEIDREQRIKR